MNSRKIKPVIFTSLFVMIVIGFGILSASLGKELCWDLANYHYYNPYIFFNSRHVFWPASFIHQFFNPVIDFLGYFLINHFSAKVTQFTLGALHGLNFILIFFIAREFKCSIFLGLAVASLGMLGATAFPGIGSFQNDNLVSLFILTFVLLTLRTIKHAPLAISKKILIAGIFLGAGTGLKLTAAPFVIGAIASFAFLSNKRINTIFALILGILIGLMVTGGYWFAHLSIEYHNPFFPFFNKFFQSNDFEAINWLDNRFFPKSFLEAIFFPFYFSLDGRTGDTPFQDLRFPILFICLFLLAIKLIYRATKNNPLHFNYLEKFIFLFFIVSYVIWEILFSNSRYFVAMEMLVPLLIYVCIRKLIASNFYRNIIVFCIFLFLVITTFPGKMIRAPWYKGSFFNIQLPIIVSNYPQALTLVNYSMFALGPNPRPQSYLIPFFPPEWQFIGIPFLNNEFSADEKTNNKIKTLITEYKFQHNNSAIFILSSDFNLQEMLRIAKTYGLSLKQPCDLITSDRQRISNQNVLLCLMH